MPDYKDLEVWKKSMRLAGDVYKVTAGFPKEEVYGLTNQIRRSAVSIPSNIAEGSGRAGSREFLQFLSIARGSSAELETQLLLATEIGYLPQNSPVFSGLSSVRQMLNGLIRSLKEPR